jgi:SAM-dependent methyltransferase
MSYSNASTSSLRHILWNYAMHLIGFVYLLLAYSKSKLKGYTTPTVFGNDDLSAIAKHSEHVFLLWKRALQNYVSDPMPFTGKKVLELGPGDSLATGMLIAFEKSEYYDAFDMYPLACSTPVDLYTNVLPGVSGVKDVGDLSDLVWNAIQGKSNYRFSYVVDPEFNLSKMARGRDYDLIVSCATFEHLDFVEQTIQQLSRIAKPGCVLCAVIDFQTHSRWIREKDPNNIYRYSDFIYKLFYFPGQPNRVRPIEYINYLRKFGWTDIRIVPSALNKEAYLRTTEMFMHKNFRSSQEKQMLILGGHILARFESGAS